MLSLIKYPIRKILGRFGRELRLSTSAFAVQKSIFNGKASTVFDVGANVGRVTQQYRALFPAAKIHAFEPFQGSFDRLVQNTSSDSNVVAHRLAVGDHKGTCLFNANTSPETNSILPTDPRASLAWGEGFLDTEQQVEVPMTTIDSFAAENQILNIDVLKLDIQGAELIALQGAREMLSRQAISLIYLELLIDTSYVGQGTLYQYIEYLESLKFSLLDFYNPIRKNLRLIQMDAIFINSELRGRLASAA